MLVDRRRGFSVRLARVTRGCRALFLSTRQRQGVLPELLDALPSLLAGRVADGLQR